jgi:hypothetical protein
LYIIGIVDRDRRLGSLSPLELGSPPPLEPPPHANNDDIAITKNSLLTKVGIIVPDFIGIVLSFALLNFNISFQEILAISRHCGRG